MTDPFSILGIAPGASEAEIRAAWRARVREHPPDSDPEGFERVRLAYETVRDPVVFARALLDAPVPAFPPPRTLPAAPPDVPGAARALLRWLLATCRLDVEDRHGR